MGHTMRFEYNKAKDQKQDGLPKPYNLDLPVEEGFHKAKDRVLVIIEHISSGDLRMGGLMRDEITRETYANVMQQAERYARIHGAKPQAKYAYFNFNYLKTYDLAEPIQRSVRKLAAKRVKDYVKDLKPTLIIVVGDRAAATLLDDQDADRKRGWVREYRGIPIVTTVDFDRAYSPPKEGSDDLSEEAVVMANILGYVTRNIGHGFIGKHPYSLRSIKADYKLIDTIAKFDSLMARLERARAIAVDTEGTSLQTVENKLQTLQFAVNHRYGYIVPIGHKDAKWTAKELAYITNRLQKFFSQKMPHFHGKDTRYLIGQNFGYDIRMLMRALNIRHLYWKVWDGMGGEASLDENIKGLEKMGPGQFNLAQMLMNYDNDFYFTNKVSKGDRTRIAEMSLTPATLRYMAMDVVGLFGIHEMQQKRASLLAHEKGSYQKGQRLLMLNQMSSMVKVMSVMRSRGTQLDVPYLLGLLKPDSIIVGKLEEFTKEFYSYPEVGKADQVLRKAFNAPTGTSPWSSGGQQRVFNLKTKEHLKTLFVDVLGFKPLEYGKSGEPKLDKYFTAAYKDESPIIETFIGLTEIKTLKSMFIDAFFKALEASADCRADERIHPEFGYVDVVTGRSNSSKPSLQQIPEHKINAKIVKRMFITAAMMLHYEADFSAHEIRCWGIMSGDTTLVKSLTAIHQLIVDQRKKYLLKGKPTEEEATVLAQKADPHRQNYSFFSGKKVEDVTKDERQDAKQITFGAMYGKGPAALAGDLKKSLDEALDILKRFFAKFPKAKSWLDWAVSFSRKNLYVYNPLFRRRNLFGYLSAHPAVVAAMQRRAQNSPIQGFASEICYIAAELFCEALHESLETLGVKHDNTAKATTADCTHLPVGPNVQVHDSLKGEAHIDHFLLTIHLLEWSMTTGVRAYIEKAFNTKINTPFDIDMEIGAGWALKQKWDWSHEGLKECLINALTLHKEVHTRSKEVQALDPEKTYKHMITLFEKQKTTLKLDSHYPLNM